MRISGRGLAAIDYKHCSRFLYYYFLLVQKKLDEKGTGTTFRAISADVIRSNYISLPPLPEQHRIVTKIEELFASLDKGIEALKTAQQQLKVYRQAVGASSPTLAVPLAIEPAAFLKATKASDGGVDGGP